MMEIEESSCPSESGEEAGGGKDIRGSSVKSGTSEKSSIDTKLSVLWTGSAGKTPLIQFRADALLGLETHPDHPYSGNHRLTFKLSGENRLVHTLLLSHGFSEVSLMNARFNVYWSGSHAQMSEIRALMPHQRINHFPRSYMITRKDRLCQNISRMQHAKGVKHFNIIPTTFVLPEELPQFRVHFRKKRGTWIVKPVSLSRGRGITIINHPNQAKIDEPMVVSQYIERPLIVNGYKFDLRIYVAVTSFNPLKIYIYEEGMARFATERYSGPVQLDNLCMHLTNYSVNKKSSQYVRCDSPGRDDYGSKWSMSALLRHLQEQGKNVAEMMMKVEDVIIKALIAGESHIISACDVFQTHRRSCFELYGFDILIDKDLRPWLLEINLSPSLGCDTPFDLRLKSNLIADLLTLVGVPLCDPYTRETPKPPTDHQHRRPTQTPWTQREKSSTSLHALTSEEATTVRDCWQEYERRCGFVRVFPSHDSWDLYSSLLESKGRLNLILHQRLYPGKIKAPSHSPTPLFTVIARRASISTTTQMGLLPLERVAVYLRKLENGPKLKPLWDSVCELLWRRDSPATTGLGTRTEPDPLHLTDISSPTPEPVQSLLINIKKLSKVQARKLFAVYLERVQARLSEETSTLYLKSREAHDKANLDVIVHFLKCAAKSLCSPFTLIEPSTELPMRHRKGMLARQLAEFITLYTKETEDLAANPNQALGLPGNVLDAALSTASEKELERLLAAYAEHSHSSAVLFGRSARSSGETPKPRVPKSGKHVLSRHSHLSRVLQRQSRVSRSGSPHPSGSQHDDSTSTACKTLGVGYGDALDVLTGSSPLYDFKKYSDRPVKTSYWTSGDTHSMQDSSGYAGDGVREEVSRDPQSPERWGRKVEGGFKEEDKGARKKIGREGLVRQQSPERWARGEGGVREEGSGRRARGRRLLRRTLSNQSLHSVTSNTSVQTMRQSVLQSIRTNSIGLIRPQSATLISKTKTYVSPYAQPVLPVQRRPLPADSQRKSLSGSLTKSKPRSKCDEDSISKALHRLTVRQMTRQHPPTATTRPPLPATSMDQYYDKLNQ